MRLSELTEANLNASQQALLETIRSGPRGAQHGKLGLVGPFGVWVRAPHVGDPVQALGAALRYGTGLAENVKEVAICTVGAHHKAEFEFAAHRRLALQAGVDEAALEALAEGVEPQLAGDEALAHRVATSLLQAHRLDDDTYAAALAAFGESGVIELVSVIGYYVLVALTLNAFEVPLTAGMTSPFPEG